MKMNKRQALYDLKKKYATPGDPLYMSAINTIKDYYKNILSIEDIRNFLAKSRAYTIHYEFKSPVHNPYYIRRLRQMIQVDLTEISKISSYNSGYNFLLVAIDCFSRKIWVRLLKNKSSNEVLANFKDIIENTGPVESVSSDRGSEWINKKMKDFCANKGIELRNPYTTFHSPHVERVQLTLQSLIYKHITSTMNFRFIDKLEDIVKTYNNRKHRMTKLTPENGEKKENSLHIQQMHENYYNKIKPTKVIKFNVRDLVRIARTKPKFGRGYDKKSPEEIYRIINIIKKFPRVLYKIETLDGEDVIGYFYQEQLTKVINQNKYIIEKILRHKNGKALVQFLGYKKPEWILQKDISSHKDIQ